MRADIRERLIRTIITVGPDQMGARMSDIDVRKYLDDIATQRGIEAFVSESNRIEGIHRAPTNAEIKAHTSLIRRKRVKVEHVESIVAVCQPDARLRSSPDIPGVRVGSHIAPPSGPKVVEDLSRLLKRIADGSLSPWAAHVEYETLHPFTDGNGRSGRAIWLWNMTLRGQLVQPLRIGFLHTFYYQTLAAKPVGSA